MQVQVGGGGITSSSAARASYRSHAVTARVLEASGVVGEVRVQACGLRCGLRVGCGWAALSSVSATFRASSLCSCTQQAEEGGIGVVEHGFSG